MIADLHIHSRYSRATSKEGNPENLDLWARKKGISIVGTGDFTHPAWREELAEKLVPAEDGLYRLKEDYVLEEAKKLPGKAPRFVVTGEISSIYKKNDKVRKVHSLLLLPGLEDAEKLSKKLETIGNIHSDGRPILGLDCHDLLEIMLELCPQGMYIPAHIWTPHFSVFGAFSGFRTMEECFEDMTPYIHAVETGLSSDPPMNWRLSGLDRFQLVSNSDAHSPSKLGREANLLDIGYSYEELFHAVQEGKGLDGTIEFFPEEGKYHYDGHRKCNICLSPEEAEKYHGKCPVCGRKMTIGVDHRIMELADRAYGFVPENAKAYESLVPLPEVLAAVAGHSAASRKVQEQYEHILRNLGSEFAVLREVPIEDIRRECGYLTAEGIKRLREGKVIRRPGFDGEYGTIKLFENEEIRNIDGQMSLFGDMGQWKIEKQEQLVNTEQILPQKTSEPPVRPLAAALNPQQKEAVEAIAPAVAVIAGPGTGKTKTLVSRILYLLETRKVKPSEITAVTFTNQAADEMKNRLAAGMQNAVGVRKMNIGTFHSISLKLLRKSGIAVTVISEEEALELAKQVTAEYRLQVSPGRFLQTVSQWKTTLHSLSKEEKIEEPMHSEKEKQEVPKEALCTYQKALEEKNQMDFDDLLLKAWELFDRKSEEKKVDTKPFTYLLVDEFQDINPLQYKLIQAWTAQGRELFVIGDPDQSIYGFRGSDAGCFEHLKQDCQGVKVIRLCENYRSGKKILEAAEAVISHNPGGNRGLHSNKEKDIPVRVLSAGGKLSEAILAAREINRLIGGIDMLDTEQQDSFRDEKPMWTFRDIAVLYRTHQQGKLLEKCLSQEGIPYIVSGRESFLEAPLVRGSISFFRSLRGEEACKKEAVQLLWKLENPSMAEMIYEEMSLKYQKKWKRTKPQKLLEGWIKELGTEADSELVELSRMAVCYQNMDELLDALTLGEEADLKRCGGKTYQADAVSLMTLHGSKGLEFPAVILFGADKGLIPLENEAHPADIEEERRLFYVGMTRAREELMITCGKESSSFLEELPKADIIYEKKDRQRAVETVQQMSLFDFI